MREICIYCMGDYGLETYFKLKEKGIKVKCFGDRDISKQGYALEGIPCISQEDVLKLDKIKTILVVAIKNPQALIQLFRDNGFVNVYDRETIFEIIDTNNTEQIADVLTDIEQIECFKRNLENLFYGNVCVSGMENHDMQGILDDLALRRRAD